MKRLYLLSSFLFTFLSKVLSQGQDSFTGIEMDWQEKDKILACVEIVSKKFNTDLVSLLNIKLKITFIVYINKFEHNLLQSLFTFDFLYKKEKKIIISQNISKISKLYL